MDKQENLQRIALGVVRVHDTVLLIERRKQETTDSGEKLSWVLPGGKSELGETVFETVAREVAEETGYQVSPIRELDAGRHSSFPVYVHYIACRLARNTQEEVGDSGVVQTKWVQIAKLGLYITSSLNERVDEYLHE